MRPLDGAMDRFPALPGPRLRGRIRPLRGSMDRRRVLRRTRRRASEAFQQPHRATRVETEGSSMNDGGGSARRSEGPEIEKEEA